MKETPTAFMSYARSDDDYHDGRLTGLRARLIAAVKSKTGGEFTIFQDKESLRVGDEWEKEIGARLDSADFLIPIMSPSFFSSDSCRREVRRFVAHRNFLEVAIRIHPIYYIEVAELENKELCENDEIAKILSSYQRGDWRQLRLENSGIKKVRVAIDQFAKGIAEAIAENSKGVSDETVGEQAGSTVVSLPRISPDAARRPSRRHSPRAVQGNRRQIPDVYRQLEENLSNTVFRPAEWTIMAAKTRSIRAFLERDFPMYPVQSSEVFLALDGLRKTLTAITRPDTSIDDIGLGCEEAERIRLLLIELISNR